MLNLLVKPKELRFNQTSWAVLLQNDPTSESGKPAQIIQGHLGVTFRAWGLGLMCRVRSSFRVRVYGLVLRA